MQTTTASPLHPVWQESPELSAELNQVLSALPTPWLWLAADRRVVRAHPAIEGMRVLRAGAVGVPELVRIIDAAAKSGVATGDNVRIRRTSPRNPETVLRVKAAPMVDGACLVLVEDISEATRLDSVRRDFVANVSHEIKTPVGALSLLAEAVAQANGDPELITHFSEQMRAETGRLSTLVNDLLDLSRLEGIDAPAGPQTVAVDEVVGRAIEDTRTLARANEMDLVRGGTPGLFVSGVPNQLITAVRNLITNAVNYSPAGTKAAITTGSDGKTVTIAVTDHGIGIPRRELARIFERFYRVDPARSRHTGGTGLGLAIVKHVCANHGGECTVWSRLGEGSTFTIRLPELHLPAVPPDWHGERGAE